MAGKCRVLGGGVVAFVLTWVAVSDMVRCGGVGRVGNRVDAGASPESCIGFFHWAIGHECLVGVTTEALPVEESVSVLWSVSEEEEEGLEE